MDDQPNRLQDRPATDPHPSSPEEATAADEDEIPRSRRAARPRRKRLSEVLLVIAADESRTEITISDLMHIMEGRARAALIFLFAFPNVLPAPPGLSAILGLPLLYLTAQMMLGRFPWLPRIVAERGISMSAFRSMIDRALPLLTRAEKLLRPRLSWMVRPMAERLLGAFALILAVIITLPIPLANMLPAFAICVIALGVLERDGLWTAAGVLIGLASLALSGAVAYAMVKAALFLLFNAFS